MKTPVRVVASAFALAGAALSGCIVAATDRVGVAHVHSSGTVLVEHEYVYFPAYHAYYCEENDGWWVREGAGWSRASRPPAFFSVTSDVPWVTVRVAGDEPFVHHDRHSRDFPEGWRPARPKGPPPGRGWRR